MSETTLRELQEEVRRRYTERRDVYFRAVCMAAEAGKALDAANRMFRADTGCYVDRVAGFKVEAERSDLAEKLADVLFYAAAVANSFGWDLAEVFAAKMQKNDEKYSEASR